MAPKGFVAQLIFIFQELVAKSTGHTHGSWWRQKEQQSEEIYLEKEKEYYFEADVIDGGGDYYLALGLWDGQTERTESQVWGAVDEVQEILINSTIKPEKQVSFVI